MRIQEMGGMNWLTRRKKHDPAETQRAHDEDCKPANRKRLVECCKDCADCCVCDPCCVHAGH